MAGIPGTYNDSAPGFVAPNTADPSRIEMAGSTARAVEAGAGAIQKTAMTLGEMQAQADEATWMSKAMSDAEVARGQAAIDFKNANSADPLGKAPVFAKQMQDIYGGMAENAPTTGAKRAFLDHANSLAATDANDIADWANTQSVKNFGQRLDDTEMNLGTAAMRAKHPNDLGPLYAQADAAVVAGSTFVPADQLDKLHRSMKESIATGYLDGARSRSPGEAVHAIDSGKFDGIVDPHKLAQQRTEAEAAIKKEQAEARQAAAMERATQMQTAQGVLQTLNAGTPVDLSKVDLSSLKPEERTTVSEQLNDAAQFATTFQTVKFEDPAKLDASLNEARQNLSSLATSDPTKVNSARKNLDTLQRAVSERTSQLQEKPFDYMMQSPAMLAVAQKVNEAPDDASRNAAQNQFVTSMVGEQKRLGVPEGKIQVMSSAQAEAVAGSLNGSTDARAAVSTISSLQQLYGQNYGYVARQLADKGVSGAVQVAAARAQDDPQMASTLITAMANQKQLKEIVDANHAPGTPMPSTQIEAGVAAAFEDFSKTLPSQWIPNASDKIQSLQKSTQLLALAYTQQGNSPSDAAQMAANKVINDHYDFAGTYRVPKQYTAVPVDQITKAHLADITNRGDFDLNRHQPGQDFQVQKDLEGTELRSQGFWLTTSDDQGMVLMHPQYGPVMNHGKPIVLRFDEMGATKAGKRVAKYANIPVGN